jgi:hypothetical protein
LYAIPRERLSTLFKMVLVTGVMLQRLVSAYDWARALWMQFSASRMARSDNQRRAGVRDEFGGRFIGGDVFIAQFLSSDAGEG